MNSNDCWADCSCCWPQKPKIRKAVGWTIMGDPDKEIPPYWYLEISGWPKGHFDTWAEALKGALRYLESEDAQWRLN